MSQEAARGLALFDDIRQHLRHLLIHGRILDHKALRSKLQRQDMKMVDCVNVIRGGRPGPLQRVGDDLQCTIRTQKFTVRIAIIGGDVGTINILEVQREAL